MTELIEQLKEAKYKLQRDQSDIIDNEFTNHKTLGINLNILAEC